MCNPDHARIYKIGSFSWLSPGCNCPFLYHYLLLHMSVLPKPQPCDQNWLAMQPTANGRRCGQCEKEIFDFSAMSWPEIVRTQAAHGHTLCGMYAPKQLEHWGQSPPSPCARLAAATTLALTLSAIPAPAQNLTYTRPAAGRTLSGTVLSPRAKGKFAPAPGVTVMLKGTNLGAATDDNGHYELVIPDTVCHAATIVFSSIGYLRTEWPLPPSQGPLQHDATLVEDDNPLAVFSVPRPSLLQRARWTLKRWFGREQE
jgi:hypothetical protein